jgi:hypothetical protein
LYIQAGTNDNLAMGVCLMSNLEKMTNAQLKKYLADHRNDDDAFNEALEVLMHRRDPNVPKYSPDMTLEEIKKTIEEKLKNEK